MMLVSSCRCSVSAAIGLTLPAGTFTVSLSRLSYLRQLNGNVLVVDRRAMTIMSISVPKCQPVLLTVY